ncbi:FAD-binding protein, partial [Pseudomonas syringae]
MNTVDRDASQALVEQVNQALQDNTPLRIRGGNSKAGLGREVAGIPLDTREHRGIVSYDPTELVITARAGTPLSEVLQALDAAGQMLPCEPPDIGAATLGGVVAAGPECVKTRQNVVGAQRLLSVVGYLAPKSFWLS